MGIYSLKEGLRTFLWASCTCIGIYVVYRCWKKRKLKAINESFKEISKLLDKPQKRVVLLGLKGAGKTLLMNQMTVLNNNEFRYIMPPQPTEGSLMTRVKDNLSCYSIWEGGMETLEDVMTYCTMFIHDTDLLIFVVDSNDTDKLSVAVSSIKQLMDEPELSNTPMLIVANKQDCPNALKPEQIEQALGLSQFLHKQKIEFIGCQTEPLPCLSEEEINYKWYHGSIPVVMEKIFSMVNNSIPENKQMLNKRLRSRKHLELG